MEQLDCASLDENTIEKNGRSKGGKKRKWREIEEIKERRRLLKELQEIDCCSVNDERFLCNSH